MVCYWLFFFQLSFRNISLGLEKLSNCLIASEATMLDKWIACIHERLQSIHYKTKQSTTLGMLYGIWYLCSIVVFIQIIIPSTSTKLKGGYTGFTLSVCPSVHPSVRPSVCLWTESCLLCIFNNSCWIHFIFAHLIKQAASEGVLCVKFVSELTNLKFWQIL